MIGVRCPPAHILLKHWYAFVDAYDSRDPSWLFQSVLANATEYFARCDWKHHDPNQWHSSCDIPRSFDDMFTTNTDRAVVTQRYSDPFDFLFSAVVAIHTASLNCVNLYTRRVIVHVVATQ